MGVVADYPGLAEVLKFSLGGYNASRRCRKKGVLDEVLRQVVYTAARENARHPCQPKSVEDILKRGAAAQLCGVGRRAASHCHRDGVHGSLFLEPAAKGVEV